jgi:hypothetical protein
VQAEDTVEAAGPVGATPDATAGADQAQLAQTAGITGVGTVQDPASSGVSLSEVPTSGAAGGRTGEGGSSPVGGTPSQSSGSPGDAPGGETEHQGPGPAQPPAP